MFSNPYGKICKSTENVPSSRNKLTFAILEGTPAHETHRFSILLWRLLLCGVSVQGRYENARNRRRGHIIPSRFGAGQVRYGLDRQASRGTRQQKDFQFPEADFWGINGCMDPFPPAVPDRLVSLVSWHCRSVP